MPFPTYTVNNVPMFDPNGRWHEHAEQSTLPAYPGLRSASLSVPGVGGEIPLPQAPIEPADFVLHMVINAVDETGRRPASYAEKLRALNTNIQSLLRIFRAASMTQGGFATITLHHNASAAVSSSGILQASIETEYDPGADYCEAQFIFRRPYGVWRGKFVDEKIAAGSSGKRYITGLSNSTAPIDGPSLIFAGPFTSLTVTNQYGNGFKYTRTLTATEAVYVNPEHWSASEPFTITEGAATIPLNTVNTYLSPHISQVGHASGTALTLIPETDGIAINVTGTGRSSSTAIHVQTTEAFF